MKEILFRLYLCEIFDPPTEIDDQEENNQKNVPEKKKQLIIPKFLVSSSV